VGGTCGWFIGNVLFLVLESAEFSNTYIRPYVGLDDQNYGLVTIKGFMTFFGVIYLATTTLVLFFKRETDNSEHVDEEHGCHDYSILETYQLIWKILKLKPILKLFFVLITLRVTLFNLKPKSYSFNLFFFTKLHFYS
jgi:PAT family acetyl-CoA transporter-like MFS transporter 1